MEDLLGLLIDNYQIESILGKGGMGIVYKAYDLQLERFVAIKMINAETSNREKFVEKFKSEAKNQAKLHHPNIVTVYGFIEYMNFLGIIMEYVEGECLDNTIKRKGKLSLEDSVYILKQVLYAIGYAHSKGFIHRDIKPSNIIMSRDGIAKIMDFGISKPIFEKSFKRASGRVGTIYYMSPEQLKGMDADVSSDIYSTGCTFYELVSGEPPFNAENEYELIDHHLNTPPPGISGKNKEIPQLFDQIIHKSLNKLPKERYRSTDEFLSDLRALEDRISSNYGSKFGKKYLNSGRKKLYSWTSLIGFTISILALLYFIFTQVHALMTSNELDRLRDYDLQTLFNPGAGDLDIVEYNLDLPIDIVDLEMTRSGEFLICSDSGEVFLFENDFNVYAEKDLKYFAVDLLQTSDGAIYGIEPTSVFKSLDFFQTADKKEFGNGYNFFAIRMRDETDLFAAGSKGIVLRFNRDLQWSRSRTDSEESIFDIDFWDDKTGIAVGWNGSILRTTDGGDNWTSVNSPVKSYLKGVALINDLDGIIIGGRGTIMVSNDGGLNWRVREALTAESLYDVSFWGNRDAIAVGAKGLILISSDKGENWVSVGNNNYHTLNRLYVNRHNEVYAAGNGGVVLRIKKIGE